MSLKSQQLDRIKYLVHGHFLDDFMNQKESYEIALEKYRQTIEKMDSSEELHQFVCNYNWDDGINRLEWVLSHPLCDSGTALLIFWTGEPACYYKFSTVTELEDWQRPSWIFLKDIEKKYLNRSFLHHDIKIDPSNIHGDNCLQIRNKDEEMGIIRIPYGMCIPSSGKPLKPLKLM